MESGVQNSTSFQPRKLNAWLEHRSIRWLWWVIGLLWLALVTVQLLESPLSFNDSDSLKLTILIPYTILFAAVWIIVGILLRSNAAKNHAFDLLELKHKLSIQLALAPDWDSLVEVIIAFCRYFIDLESVVILVRAPQSDLFETAVQRKAKPEPARDTSTAVPADILLCLP